ncbi:MAG TPA: hypothetical protein VG477_11910 [Thermoanaerobaculia bacterium]|nr:hypothetical protein [Thermoanaerobaculia bacterium]
MSYPGRRIAFGLLLPVLLLAGALPLAASPRARMLAPEDGAELVAGSVAVVQWEEAPPGAVEWEAFLSVDGGRTYPLRVTPHLDLSIRRFAFQVPAFPTRSARVLLRFGDERREVEVETPQRFSIAARGGSSAWNPAQRIALSRGEKARPGEEGVVFWVHGTRDGGGLRQVAAVPVPLSLLAVEDASLFVLPLFWPARDRVSLPAPTAEGELIAAIPQSGGNERFSRALAAAPIRLLIHRFNE